MKRNLRKEFIAKGFEEATYKKYWLKNTAHYIIKKLQVILYYSEGMSITAITEKTGQNLKTINKYLNLYLQGGFEQLCEKQKQPRSCRLEGKNLEEFKWVLIHKRPQDYGLQGAIWTGNSMINFVYLFFGISYSKGIYPLLDRIGLSYQKAHQDYLESDPVKAKAHLTTLQERILEGDEKTAIICFDEFSISELPTAYRAWAPRNTRPKIGTRQKKDNEQMPY